MIIFLLLNSQLQMDVRRMCHAENCCIRHRGKLAIFVFFLGSSCVSFFFFFFLSLIPFDFKIWIDWLAFRPRFHVVHR